MYKTFITIHFLFVVFTITAAGIHAQNPSAQPPASQFDESYGIFTIANTSGKSPEFIIKLDNNFEILRACVRGKTIDQLAGESILFTRSQLQLLINWGLVEQEDTTFTTTFPILEHEKTLELRDFIRISASIVGQYLEEGINSLKRELAEKGKENNLYTLFFSYMLDDLAWRIFEAKNIEIKGPITVDQPFWSGVVWAADPKRDVTTGTTTVASKGAVLKINWNRNIMHIINELFGKFDTLGRMIVEIEKLGMIEDTEIREHLQPFNIIDDSGKPTALFIQEVDDDPVFAACRSVTETICSRFLHVIDFTHLTKEIGLLNEMYTFAISYYEFEWELMLYLVQENIISQPPAFRSPETAQLKDLRDLVIIIKYAEQME